MCFPSNAARRPGGGPSPLRRSAAATGGTRHRTGRLNAASVGAQGPWTHGRPAKALEERQTGTVHAIRRPANRAACRPSALGRGRRSAELRTGAFYPASMRDRYRPGPGCAFPRGATSRENARCCCGRQKTMAYSQTEGGARPNRIEDRWTRSRRHSHPARWTRCLSTATHCCGKT